MTTPKNSALDSAVMGIGEKAGFSGMSRTVEPLSSSRLTVNSPSSAAMMISPLAAVMARSTTRMSPSSMPAPIMLSPRARM